jgi:hypothetical protein
MAPKEGLGMNDALFERLLHEEESSTLDFKEEQYRFVKASDEEKSELLKDILGFANAWRRSEAYILIGVEDVRGGRGNVVGIPAAHHLDDHSLQQFVNNLTNRPVRFHYEAFGFEGKQVGIIRIEEQQALPLYLKQNYGKLKKTEVYVRRGSSTDPTKPAGPDEIALMGRSSGVQNAELTVEFAHVERDDSLGTHMSWEAKFCETPPREAIPDLAHERTRHPLGLDLSYLQLGTMDRLNPDYFRELAGYQFARRLFRPVRLAVTNVGEVAASSVRAELTVLTSLGVMVMDSSDMPDAPKRRADFTPPGLRKIRPAFRRDPGEVVIDRNDERFRVEIDCGSLQPGRRVWSDVFYIGKRASGDLPLSGRVFAENLPQPEEFMLLISVQVTETKMSVAQLRSLPDPETDDD